MERKSPVKDVHKINARDYVELYKILCSKLDADNPFAKFSIGGGFYVWTDNRCQWQQMIVADDLEQTFIREAFYQTKKSVAAAFDEKTADILFTTPDDSYIYYNDDSEQIRILIAGWGFKKPVRIGGHVDVDVIPKENPVTVSFSNDGMRLSNYEFGIQLPRQLKHLHTGDDGLYKFKNLKVGGSFPIKDLKSGNDFTLNIVEGQSHYDFDVTVYSTLTLKATEDGRPIIGEEAVITYNGKEYRITTDDAGMASVKLPVHDGMEINASFRDQTKSEEISANGNEMEFSFVSPVKPHEADIEVSVTENGAPVANANVDIDYNGNHYSGTTNGQGKYVQHVNVVENEPCTVTVPDYAPQSKALEKDKVNVFQFEKYEVPKPPKFLTPHILIQGDEGFIGSRYPISVEYNGAKTDYVSDDNGIVPLPAMEVGKTMKVYDGLNPDNTAVYELEEDKLEYVFHVPYVPINDNRDIKVIFRDYENKPIVCDRVRFVQGTTERLMSLDSNGCTYLDKNTFKVAEPITTTIMGANREFSPIEFAIEADENEYLLQEKNTTGPTWLRVLLQILAVLATIAVLWLLWPLVEGFFYGMFNVIY